MNIEQLADEIHAEHVARFSRRRSQPKPRRLPSCYTRVSGRSIRLLSAREVEEFRAHVARCIEVRS